MVHLTSRALNVRDGFPTHGFRDDTGPGVGTTDVTWAAFGAISRSAVACDTSPTRFLVRPRDGTSSSIARIAVYLTITLDPPRPLQAVDVDVSRRRRIPGAIIEGTSPLRERGYRR